MKKIENYFKIFDKYDNIAHAFLIGNTNYSEIQNELENVISKYIFDFNVELNNCSDVILLGIDNKNITKQMIKNLLISLKITSQISNKKVYIINNAEKLNESVYNSLLKILEEPSKNIYAILISNNIDSVATTIKSRCQIIYANSVNTDLLSEYSDLALSIFKSTETSGFRTIGLYSDIYTKLNDRESVINVIKELYNMYFELIKEDLNNIDGALIKMINKNYYSREIISKKMIFLNKLLILESNNVNKDMLIDELIDGLWRCNNEEYIC